MSVSVQLTADMARPDGPVKLADSGTSADSAEFSSLIEDCSAECAGQDSNESGLTEDQTNTDDDGNLVPQQDEDVNASGNNLPFTPDLSEHDFDQDRLESNVTPSSAEERASRLDLLDRIDGSLSIASAETVDVIDVVGQSSSSRTSEMIHEIGLVNSDTSKPDATLPSIALAIENKRIGSSGLKQGSDLYVSDISTPPVNNFFGSSNREGQIVLNSEALIKGQDGATVPELFDQRDLKALTESALGGEDLKEMNIDSFIKESLRGITKQIDQVASSVSNTPPNVVTGVNSSVNSFQNSLGLGQSSSATGSGQLLTLGTEVTDQAWADDFSVRIRTLVSGNVQQATLNLRPAELGAISVNLTTEGSETKAQFAVQNAVVREVIESSMPRLREIFQESGLSLTDTDVRDESFSQHAQDQTDRERDGLNHPATNPLQADVADESVENAEPSLMRWDGNQLRGGVDTFI